MVVRLGVMMFLEFFVWGAWFVTMGSYLTATLHFTDPQSALAYATQSWGAIIAPFVIGLIADKYVNAERLLGVIHLIGAALMYVLASATQFDPDLSNNAATAAVSTNPATDLTITKTNNGSADVPSVILPPVAVTKDNIKSTVVADGFWTTAEILNTPALKTAGAAVGLQ